MSDRPPLNFKPAEAADSVVARILTPRTVIYLIALFGVMFLMRRYDTAASENNNKAALKLEPVARPATLGQPAERLPMLLVFDPGDSDGLPELIGAVREQFAGRCNITRVDVSKDPGALAHFQISQAPAALLYDRENREIARRTTPLPKADDMQRWLDTLLQPAAAEN
jgi:hypothetical protein